ncbi:MAG: UDP-glucose/GDP-mannose dehydrogenase family protein [Bradymonadales bacterium]|nr:MAG: UDP-glucose/GDP-mannose dehydrogenase family protein [Bradymonadales bacterium]
MKICVFGAGYVGLVQAAGLASTGNTVFAADVSEEKLKLMREGKSPIFEAGLEELIQAGLQSKRLHFLHVADPAFERALRESRVIFVAVGTPEKPDGSSDLSYLFKVMDQLSSLEGELRDKIVVIKSTVPVGTGDEVEDYLRKKSKFPVVASNPEFLKQGSAVQDFLKPERVIIGTLDPEAMELLAELHHPFMLKRDRIISMSRRSAELVKYACNCFLATKISFINEMARLAEAMGADIREIRAGMITDSRIGDQFLFPGIGYGGSCLPKDSHSLVAQGKALKEPMKILEAIDFVNRRQRAWVADKLEEVWRSDFKGKVIGLWGLAFKPNTDDLREAPSVDLIRRLIGHGAKVQAHDPAAIPNVQKLFAKELKEGSLQLFEEPYDALGGAHALAVLTEWPEYRSPDFDKIKVTLAEALVLDGRNIYDAASLRKKDFTYYGVGAPGGGPKTRPKLKTA